MQRVTPEAAVVRSRRAHTLWEVLLVIALLGVIGVLIAPLAPTRRSMADEDQVARTAGELVQLFGSARLMALQRGEAVQVVLDPAAGRLWLFATDHGATRLVGDRVLGLPPAVGLQTPDARMTIRFGADGSTSGGRVLVRSEWGSRLVTVDRWTGEADAQ